MNRRKSIRMFKFGGVPMVRLKHRWGEKVRNPRCGRVKENDVPKKRRRRKRGERRRHKAISEKRHPTIADRNDGRILSLIPSSLDFFQLEFPSHYHGIDIIVRSMHCI